MARSKFNKRQVIEILSEDLDDKKSFPAKWELECEVGGDTIEEGDDFFYVGGKKVCNDCRSEIKDVLEEL